MFKSIVAVIVSYIAMFVVFMAIFFGLYFALGVERVFQPDSYEVSMLWIITTLVVAFLVTMFAGYLCAAISKSWRTCQVFALIVFLLALWQCFQGMRRDSEGPNVRAGDVTYRSRRYADVAALSQSRRQRPRHPDRRTDETPRQRVGRGGGN
jgi:hypothetical protein